ncbi:hypothetical protein MTR67_041560 [Solanum verrucosum]|uniref:S-protein homolog n=1 Tax=Solanum verrucosum TaxID=315347 RepID=A0AAF0UKZ1_SOLVR|nr:hypothetical protein MTR67_041560 [Solanum verrucosum]
MDLPFINIFLLLLLFITPFDLSLAQNCFLSEKYQIHVINKLPFNSPQLKVHCASKDDDFGDHYPAINEDFNWSFCNFFDRTLFFCHFWWDSKDKSFDVFNDKNFCVKDQNVPNILNSCTWEVRSDGFYLKQLNITDGSYYMHHYLDLLPSNSPQLKVHCASKDDDFEDYYPAINEDFNWSFCNFFDRTLFFCHFWWDSKDKVFDVFNDKEFCVRDQNVPNFTRSCKWEVRSDGFYLEQHNITDGSYYMHHYLDWSWDYYI